MTESELLIKIRTALEAGGIDAAKTKIDELTKSVDQTNATNTKFDVGAKKFVGAMNNVKNATNGNVMSMANLAGALGPIVGKAGLVGAAITAMFFAWKKGTEWANILWAKVFDLDSFDKTTGNIREGLDLVIAKVKELNEQKLSELRGQLSELDADMARFDKKTSAEEERGTKLLDTKQKTERARLEESFAGKEKGPSYDRQVAAMEKRHAEEVRQLKFDQMGKREEHLQTQLNLTELKLAEAKDRLDDVTAGAEKAQAVADAPGATREQIQAAMYAQQGVEGAKEQVKQTEEEVAKRKESINIQRYKMDTERIVADKEISGEGSSRYRGALAGADAAEQKAAAEAAQESQVAAAQKQKEEAERAGAAKIAELENRLRQAEETAKESRRAADAYTPTAGARGAAKGKMEARDQALERAAVEDAAIQATIAERRAQFTEELRRTLAALDDQLKMVKEQGRNATL